MGEDDPGVARRRVCGIACDSCGRLDGGVPGLGAACAGDGVLGGADGDGVRGGGGAKALAVCGIVLGGAVVGFVGVRGVGGGMGRGYGGVAGGEVQADAGWPTGEG